ncbi:hypothetical protein HAX54_052462, partial [Datura stramonium]|nr:hypothetical protein [Datura stramonium]
VIWAKSRSMKDSTSRQLDHGFQPPILAHLQILFDDQQDGSFFEFIDHLHGRHFGPSIGNFSSSFHDHHDGWFVFQFNGPSNVFMAYLFNC